MKIVDTQTDIAYYTQYKVVELTSVTDADIEAVLNEWSSKGWNFDGLHFAMRESSKRPSMAFILFTQSARASEPEDNEEDD